LALAAAGCSADQSVTPPPGVRALAVRSAGGSTHNIGLYAVMGSGFGGVNVTPTAEDHGTFHVQGEVHIRGASPNTTYIVQRAPDLNVADPTCTGPWISFPIPNPGPVVTLTTSTGGAGAAHFALAVGGAFVSGRSFNVRFRVIDSVLDPTSVLMSDCITVTVK
ncbi:MAG: hypothetical protein ABI120_05955, partial [Gemmatimonadaceae bacterium]